MGVDILPAELPLDSSNHFSSVLYPHVKALVRITTFLCPFACLTQRLLALQKSLGQCSEIIKNATIAENGRLVKKHQHLSGLLPKATARKKQTVLLLGSGMVAAPLVNRLVRRPNTRVVVASNVPSSTLVAGHEQAESVVLDIQDKKALSRLVAGADVVVRYSLRGMEYTEQVLIIFWVIKFGACLFTRTSGRSMHWPTETYGDGKLRFGGDAKAR